MCLFFFGSEIVPAWCLAKFDFKIDLPEIFAQNVSPECLPKMRSKNVGPKCFPKMFARHVRPKCLPETVVRIPYTCVEYLSSHEICDD